MNHRKAEDPPERMAMAMKIIKTEFGYKGNGTSSYKVYICKDWETAMALHSMAMTMKPEADGENYYSVHSAMSLTPCLTPEFFHGKKYYETIVEHNNGNWDKDPTYELYIVE